MNAPVTAVEALPTIPGTSFGGGFYAGQFRIGNEVFALIVAPKFEGDIESVWNDSRASITGAESYNDGLANTNVMAEAGSTLGKWARELRIAGHDDWYLPSRDELEIAYRNLKPLDRDNLVSFRDGDNPSSIPLGYPYTSALPAQTVSPAFREGGAEAFDSAWYWASTQYAGNTDYAWGQYFTNGSQNYGLKSCEGRARAVRRFKI